MHKKILVIGGAGYIGTALSTRLLTEGARITVFDNLSTGQIDLIDRRAEFVRGDIRNASEVEHVCLARDFDMVIHLAALKSVNTGQLEPANFVKSNVTGTLNTLEAMRKASIPNIIFSSTAAVYQKNSTGIYDESSKTAPWSMYGSTKLMSEELIRQYRCLGHLKKSIIFRYFNLAGDSGLKYRDSFAENIFPMVIKAYQEEKPFLIFGDDYSTPDGTGVRDYIHIDDLIDAHILAIAKHKSGIFNLGTKTGTSVREIVHAFNKFLVRPLKINVADRRSGDVDIAISNPEKAKRELNWTANRTIEDMVKSTLHAYDVA